MHSFFLSSHDPEANGATQVDGPYVLYNKEKVFVNYILEKDGQKFTEQDSYKLADRKNIKLTINTDIPGKTFQVTMKQKFEIEKTEFSKVNKILALSDIESNFKAFRLLLQGNGVIDTDFNWIFGNGHLVLCGDFFDRGSQLNEVLWFIYYLEDKAKAAGGYVHFILGNHEIMNLTGDLRYVHPKYTAFARLMNVSYVSLFTENTELGRWLRTKNVIEKVNDILFMHGGVSRSVNELGLSLNKLNNLVRPYYGDTTYNYQDPVIDLLYGDRGPFWYRGYYQSPLATVGQIDSTLDYYKANHVVTGHTIIAEVVTMHYGGRVFDTDVPHAREKSEALLIEDNKFYRVNNKGEKILLK